MPNYSIVIKIRQFNNEVALLSNPKFICEFPQVFELYVWSRITLSLSYYNSLVFFGKKQSLKLSLHFLKMTFLKRTGQLFYRTVLGYSAVSSRLEIGHVFLQEYHWRDSVLSESSQEGFDVDSDGGLEHSFGLRILWISPLGSYSFLFQY